MATRGSVALDRTLIEMLHSHLMEGIDFKSPPGEFRQRQNWIGGHRNIYDAKFVPPPHEYLGNFAALAEFERELISERTKLVSPQLGPVAGQGGGPSQEDNMEMPYKFNMFIQYFLDCWLHYCYHYDYENCS